MASDAAENGIGRAKNWTTCREKPASSREKRRNTQKIGLLAAKNRQV